MLEFFQPKDMRDTIMYNNIDNDIEVVKSKICAPKGYKVQGIHAGIKRSRKDMALIYSEVPALCSAVYTKNVVIAPPLKWCKKLTGDGKKIQAVIITSGNANSCTGEKGYDDTVSIAGTVSTCLNIDKDSVMVTATGVIGKYLPMDKVTEGIKTICPLISDNDDAAKNCAMAILTTDTFTKEITAKIYVGGVPVTIAGIAKGSGMIHPNMATMLNFITTDANITKELLDKSFKSCIDDSFNMITVDGETSTNDMAVILANGMAGNPIIDEEDANFGKFQRALFVVTKELAKYIVKDGEGASKFLECCIKGAKSKTDAKILCKAILNSNLVKTAFFGQDANWGRVISAMGASGADFDPNKVSVVFESTKGSIKLYENGHPISFDEDFALEILKEKEIKIVIQMSEGNFEITGWGCDLSYDYVKINAEYRS